MPHPPEPDNDTAVTAGNAELQYTQENQPHDTLAPQSSETVHTSPPNHQEEEDLTRYHFDGDDDDDDPAFATLFPCLLLLVGIAITSAAFWPLLPQNSTQLLWLMPGERSVVHLPPLQVEEAHITLLDYQHRPNGDNFPESDSGDGDEDWVPSAKSRTGSAEKPSRTSIFWNWWQRKVSPSPKSQMHASFAALPVNIHASFEAFPLEDRTVVTRTLRPQNAASADAFPITFIRFSLPSASDAKLLLNWSLSSVPQSLPPSLSLIRTPSALASVRAGLPVPPHLTPFHLQNLPPTSSLSLYLSDADPDYFLVLLGRVSGVLSFTLSHTTYSPSGAPLVCTLSKQTPTCNLSDKVSPDSYVLFSVPPCTDGECPDSLLALNISADGSESGSFWALWVLVTLLAIGFTAFIILTIVNLCCLCIGAAMCGRRRRGYGTFEDEDDDEEDSEDEVLPTYEPRDGPPPYEDPPPISPVEDRRANTVRSWLFPSSRSAESRPLLGNGRSSPESRPLLGNGRSSA
ncbi:hypothetical protein BJ742DRAFT_346596 [Cladochytrium replicatum]|nr:hypothetical protein BJ742DRAFT_346596 [Cladochytrium replicatum]